ncbi:MAG: O-antigen ligase family protein [Gemmatimonadaceae bacterium]
MRPSKSTSRQHDTLSEAAYFGPVTFFLLIHVLIGVALRTSPAAAGIHAGIVLGISIWAALRWSPIAVTCCAAYIVGAEVLWRMANAPIPYEMGKYAVSLVLLLALIRMGRRATWRPDALIYFLLLIPSAVLLFADRDLTTRTLMMRLSFNLSGPLCLCVSVWFFSQQEFRAKDVLKICVAMLGPILSIAVVTIIATRGATDLNFTGESNVVTSGGFGPNQVSAVLGLGALVALLLTLNREARSGLRLVGGSLVLLFGVQSAMTFSRGGLYGAGLALMVGLPFLLRERRVRHVLLPMGIAVTIIAIWVVLPQLQQFTGGKLAGRFDDVQTTNRGALVIDDIHVWAEHPLLGVGPGRVADFRGDIGGAGHTEYTRLLAEHGSLGALALMTLLLMSLRILLDSSERLGRGYRVIFLAWAMLSMLHAAMRIAAFGFVYGLANATFHLARIRSTEIDRAADRTPFFEWRMSQVLE